MKIEEVKTGILVFISSLIEDEIDGVKRRKGALGMVDSPVLGTGGLWWWVTHKDGAQIKYRYCEISEMKTIKVSDSGILEMRDQADDEPILDDIAGGYGKESFPYEEGREDSGDTIRKWTYDVIEKWIN